MASPVALVTASSAGLGAAVVKALAPTHRVVVNYFSRPEKADQVMAECASIPAPHKSSSSEQPRFHSIQADMASRASIQALVKETVDKMGRLDVIVSNAGWTRMVNFMDLEANVDEEDWDRCFNVNVKAHLWLFHAAKPHLEAAPGGGSFVTVASLAGVRPSGSSLPYSVTKAAEIHLTKGLATIAGPKVRCNVVSPGLMMTEWGQKFSEARVQAAKDKGALKSLASVEDVAEMVRTLVMSKSITGQNIVSCLRAEALVLMVRLNDGSLLTVSSAADSGLRYCDRVMSRSLRHPGTRELLKIEAKCIYLDTPTVQKPLRQIHRLRPQVLHTILPQRVIRRARIIPSIQMIM